MSQSTYDFQFQVFFLESFLASLTVSLAPALPLIYSPRNLFIDCRRYLSRPFRVLKNNDAEVSQNAPYKCGTHTATLTPNDAVFLICIIHSGGCFLLGDLDRPATSADGANFFIFMSSFALEIVSTQRIPPGSFPPQAAKTCQQCAGIETQVSKVLFLLLFLLVGNHALLTHAAAAGRDAGGKETGGGDRPRYSATATGREDEKEWRTPLPHLPPVADQSFYHHLLLLLPMPKQATKPTGAVKWAEEWPGKP